MDDKIALILHADVEAYRLYSWKHIAEVLNKYNEVYQFFYPIVCYSNAKTKPPKSLNLKARLEHISLRETGKALTIALQAGCEHALISPALTHLENPVPMMEKYKDTTCFVDEFQPSLYYGNTRNLERVWTNMPWNPLNSLDTNFKYFYENVLIPVEFANIITRSEVGAVTREIMSIDLIKEIR